MMFGVKSEQIRVHPRGYHAELQALLNYNGPQLAVAEVQQAKAHARNCCCNQRPAQSPACRYFIRSARSHTHTHTYTYTHTHAHTVPSLRRHVRRLSKALLGRRQTYTTLTA